MPLANKPLNEITEADLQELIDNEVPEGKEYDYKLLVGNADDDKREFLADASSFANTIGGHLIIGMDEANGIPTSIQGLSGNIDAEKLRLEEILRNGIAPRIRFEIYSISVDSGTVLVIRIPRSWTAPHMVTFKNYSRFYGRHSAGKYQLDVTELRSAFTLSETATERIRNFRLDRIAKIAEGDHFIELNDGAKLILHIIPIEGFTSATTYDPFIAAKYTDIWRSNLLQVIPVNLYRHNFDGLLFFADPTSGIKGRTYLQLFRNGSVELTDTWLLRGSTNYIDGFEYEGKLLELMPIIFKIQEQIGIQPPIIIMLSLVQVRGYKVTTHSLHVGIEYWHLVQPIDRDNLLIPDVSIEKFDDNLGKKLKPIFDAVWNSSGWPRSLSYDKDEAWNPPRG